MGLGYGQGSRNTGVEYRQAEYKQEDYIDTLKLLVHRTFSLCVVFTSKECQVGDHAPIILVLVIKMFSNSDF